MINPAASESVGETENGVPIRLRIAHVTATFPPYYAGTGMVCYYSALELARRGHDITIFTAAIPPGTYDYPSELKIRRLPPLLRFGNAPVLPGLLTLDNFDVVHLHHPFISGAEFMWAVSKLRDIPYVITHHNDLIGDGLRRYLFDFYSSIWTRLVFSGASKLAVVSLDHASSCRLTRLFRRRWDDVVEVPNGVDARLFRPGLNGAAVRQQYDVPDDATVMLFVGALDRAHHYRRVDLLLRAIEILGDSGLHLLIVGDGDRLAMYRDLADSLGIIRHVHFAGSVSHQELPLHYAAADLVVLPSQLQESFGLVLIEAFACGKPVIASNLPGVRSVVSDGDDGLLVKPGDLADLVAKVQALVKDPALRIQMGESGRRKVEELYDWRKVGARLESLYFEVLEGRAKHRSGLRSEQRIEPIQANANEAKR